jgi:hypothetical protein
MLYNGYNLTSEEANVILEQLKDKYGLVIEQQRWWQYANDIIDSYKRGGPLIKYKRWIYFHHNNWYVIQEPFNPKIEGAIFFVDANNELIKDGTYPMFAWYNPDWIICKESIKQIVFIGECPIIETK